MISSKEKLVQQALDFLTEIGISAEKALLTDTEFLPGLKVYKGKILYDENRLLYPGDILHEAGHIAITPKVERTKIGTAKMAKDWPSEGDEIATICWSYAAAKHIDFPIEALFHDNGYKNDALWLKEQFLNGSYIGLPLLEWMGLCESQSESDFEAFPKMKKWLRD
ncbi:MAG: hypothetical protein RIC95_07680 [Vicingaceae bacterium]